MFDTCCSTRINDSSGQEVLLGEQSLFYRVNLIETKLLEQKYHLFEGLEVMLLSLLRHCHHDIC